MQKKPKKVCSACGTSLVNHRLLFFSSVFGAMMDKLSIIFPFTFSIEKHPKLADWVEKILINSAHFLGIIRYDTDIEKACSGRSKVIWKEAQNRGIKMWQLVVLGKHIDNYRALVNGKIIFFQSIPVPPWLSRRGYKWVDDKFIFFQKLSRAGIPVPATKKISRLKDALVAFESLRKPIIIKPRFGSRGRHTTTNINTKVEAKKAYFLAREISPSIIAQEHLFGSVYRATVVNNVLVGFFQADPPLVCGNGVKSIQELIEEKNKNRPENIAEILINEEVVAFLERQKYALDSILPKDVSVCLSAKTGRLYGGYTKEIFKKIHPKLHAIFEKASQIVSIPVAGFDFIIEDPTQDPDTERCGIIECNSLPFIDLHYYPFEGEPINIAKYVWDMWEKKQ